MSSSLVKLFPSIFKFLSPLFSRVISHSNKMYLYSSESGSLLTLGLRHALLPCSSNTSFKPTHLQDSPDPSSQNQLYCYSKTCRNYTSHTNQTMITTLLESHTSFQQMVSCTSLIKQNTLHKSVLIQMKLNIKSMLFFSSCITQGHLESTKIIVSLLTGHMVHNLSFYENLQ